MERDAVLRRSLELPGKRGTLQLPKNGPYGVKCAFPEPIFHTLQGPIKGTVPPSSPRKALIV